MSHIVFLAFSAALLVSATVLTLDGWNNDLNDSKRSDSTTDLFESQSVVSVALDTAQFFMENSCYEYCQLEQTEEEGLKKDKLSRTIVKVENGSGEYEELDNNSIKSLPPNASVNLMIEKYTVERNSGKDKPKFYVTVESFNTTIERTKLPDFKIEETDEVDASLNLEQLELLKDWCENGTPIDFCKESSSRPL